MRNRLLASACAAVLGMGAASASAAVITYSGTTSEIGTGFGNVTDILSLQPTGSETSAYGSVLRESGGDVRSDFATPQSKTVSVAQLTTLGVSQNSIGLVLNVNEPPADETVVLQDFTLRFYTDPADLTEFFDATYDAPAGGLILTPVANPGTGSSGHVFQITFEGAEAADFFADSSNRIGALVLQDQAILNAAGGPEIFYVVPEPSSLALLGIGGLPALRRRVAR